MTGIPGPHVVRFTDRKLFPDTCLRVDTAATAPSSATVELYGAAQRRPCNSSLRPSEVPHQLALSHHVPPRRRGCWDAAATTQFGAPTASNQNASGNRNGLRDRANLPAVHSRSWPHSCAIWRTSLSNVALPIRCVWSQSVQRSRFAQQDGASRGGPPASSAT